MLRIGLTGGIGAGKSEVGRRLASHGAVVIDADQLARQVVAPGTEGFREVVAAFGPQVCDETGALDRAALAAVVFDDEPARRRLEAIIHPRVRARTNELAAAAPPDAVVVNDVPLLVEAGLAPTYQLVVVVESAEQIRLARLMRNRQMSEQQAWSRIRSQTSDVARRAAADVLLRNDGERAGLHAAVDALWHDRLVGFARNLREGTVVRRPEQLRLVPYDPTWPQQYDRLAARIGYATGGLRIDHLGSTAVPGLLAKDVIDIQLTVADLAAADAIADRLAAAGFPRLAGEWHDTPTLEQPDLADWRKRLHGGADPGRVVHLHVRPAGSPGWLVSLLLRDWLRADPAARAEYAQLKQQLAATTASTSRYAEAKEPWFAEVLPRARRWAGQAGWRP